MLQWLSELLPFWILEYLDRRKRSIAEVERLRDDRRQRRICVMCGEKYALPNVEKCDNCVDPILESEALALRATLPW